MKWWLVQRMASLMKNDKKGEEKKDCLRLIEKGQDTVGKIYNMHVKTF